MYYNLSFCIHSLLVEMPHSHCIQQSHIIWHTACTSTPSALYSPDSMIQHYCITTCENHHLECTLSHKIMALKPGTFPLMSPTSYHYQWQGIMLKLLVHEECITHRFVLAVQVVKFMNTQLNRQENLCKIIINKYSVWYLQHHHFMAYLIISTKVLADSNFMFTT